VLTGRGDSGLIALSSASSLKSPALIPATRSETAFLTAKIRTPVPASSSIFSFRSSAKSEIARMAMALGGGKRMSAAS
jgi:hypothetical protein